MEGGPHIYLDHTGAHNTALLPKRLAFSTADLLRESGTYVWLLVKEEGRFEILGSRAFTSYEIGTKHRDLYFDAGQPTVYAAGECKVIRRPQEVEVVYNLESGTYMPDIIQEFHLVTGQNNTAKAYYKNFLDTLWAQAGATIVRFTTEPMIAKLPNTLTRSVVEAYRRAGYTPYQFNTSGECTLYNTWRLRKERMGEVRDYTIWLAEEFPTLPEEYRRDPIPYVGNGGSHRRKQTKRRKRIQTPK